MTSVGVMASSVVTAVCTDVLSEPFNNLTAWTQAGSPSIVDGRTGTAVSIGSAGSTVTYTIPAVSESDTVTVGFAFRPTSWGGSETHIVELRSDTAATLHSWVSIRNDGSMRFGTGASGQDLGAAGAFTSNTWNYLELQVKLHDTTGTYQVKINGTTVLGPATIDTKNAGTKTVYDAVRLLAEPTTVLFDDLYLSTGSGCAFKGDQTIVVTPPASPTIPVTSGLTWWLDAEDTSTFTFSSGVVVSQWDDKSGNNRHATQATSGNRPSRSGIQNGRPRVVFSAGQTIGRSPVVSTASNNVSMFFAGKHIADANTIVVPFFNGNTGANGYGIALRANGSNIGFLLGALAWVPSSVADPAAAGVLTLERNANVWTLRLNGSQAAGISNSGGYNTPSGSTFVGSSGTDVIHVYEVAAYDRILTSTERGQVESYLKTKWGTP